ncbi:Origin recognition complex, subunit 2, partial [Pseudoloma neurophilia]
SVKISKPENKIEILEQSTNSLTNLHDFHLSCTVEYTELLKKFNILFYGYGCKISLLNEMFPKANVIRELPGIIQEKKINILLNADLAELDANFLPKNNVICLLDTMDPTKINFSSFDLENLNFIMKDLTTYVPYSDQTVSKTEKNMQNLIYNVSLRSKNLFKLFLQNLEKNKITTNKLLEIAKKDLLINDKRVIRQLLSEFIDHKIIKLSNEEYTLIGKKDKILEYFKD